MNRMLRYAVLAAAALATTMPARAELSEKQVQVALKAVKFIQPKMDSGAGVAFIYKEGDAGGKAAATALAAKASSLSDVPVSAKAISDAGLNLSGMRMAFLTDGAVGNAATIANAARSAKVLTVSGSTACSGKGDCVLAVETQPAVQIYLNPGAASKAGISFAAAFMMLVKKQ